MSITSAAEFGPLTAATKLALALERSPLVRRGAPVLRWRHPILGVAAFGFAIPHLDRTVTDWPWFYIGSQLLFGEEVHPDADLGPGGLHIYGDHPSLQIGPLALVLARGFRYIGTGRIAAVLVMTAMAPGLVYLLERTARRVRPPEAERAELLLRVTVFVGGLLFVQVWAQVAAVFTHLDDVLVLSFATVGLWCVANGRAGLFGVVVGLALASKPWAMMVLPLILVLPARERWKAFFITGSIAAAAWLPFIVADADTIQAMRPQVLLHPASVLRLFGVGLDSNILWVRPAQVIGALLLGALAVRRGRWPGVLAVGIAVRLLLDPGTYSYYTAGLLLAVLAWDLMRSAEPLPTWTIASFWLLEVVTRMKLSATSEAVLRLTLTLALITAVLRRSGRNAIAPRQEDERLPSA